MYTDTEEVPLKDVLLSMKKKENGAAVALDVKKGFCERAPSLFGGRCCLILTATAYMCLILKN